MRNRKISKRKILRAAATVFSEKGLENATVEDIARKAKIAKGSIYVYFKSRNEILIEAIRYLANKRITTLRKLLVKFSSPEHKLKVLLKANKKMAEKEPDMYLMNYALLLSTHKHIKTIGAREFFRVYLNLVEEIIKEGIKKDEFRSINPRVLAFMLVLTSDLGNIFGEMSPKIVNKKIIQRELLGLILN